MDRIEYKKLVDYISTFLLLPPKSDYENFDDIEHRLKAANHLIKTKYYINAIEIYKSIENMNFCDSTNISKKAEALVETARVIFEHTKNINEAQRYIDKALKLLEEYGESFIFIIKATIFYAYLDLLSKSGKENQATREVNIKILSISKEDKIPNRDLFCSYYFKGELESNKGNYEKACSFLKDAYKYCPLADFGKEKLKEIYSKKNMDYKITYEALIDLDEYIIENYI